MYDSEFQWRFRVRVTENASSEIEEMVDRITRRAVLRRGAKIVRAEGTARKKKTGWVPGSIPRADSRNVASSSDRSRLRRTKAPTD